MALLRGAEQRNARRCGALKCGAISQTHDGEPVKFRCHVSLEMLSNNFLENLMIFAKSWSVHCSMGAPAISDRICSCLILTFCDSCTFSTRTEQGHPLYQPAHDKDLCSYWVLDMQSLPNINLENRGLSQARMDILGCRKQDVFAESLRSKASCVSSESR